MKKILFLLLIPGVCFASEPELFKSSCGGVNYSIKSYCHKNNLKDDQDKLDMPICKKQILNINGETQDLSILTGVVERLNQQGDKVKMMNFVFYGVSCKNDIIILSGAGGCNSCGEMFKRFNLFGHVIKEQSGALDLEPMEEVIPDLFCCRIPARVTSTVCSISKFCRC